MPIKSLVLAFASTLAISTISAAQQGVGTIRGSVTDSAQSPLVGAVVHVSGTRLGAVTDIAGTFTVDHVPSGARTLIVRRAGFVPDSVPVTVNVGAIASVTVVLHAAAQRLNQVTVVASPRLNETAEMAMQKRRNADNILSVLSGDVIRALPNANAAEAAARIPGVSTERDEGEGKFIQIRGTEPRLSNVTINGVHIPGTQGGDRIAKLDDVPTDILAAIEISKTLTADQDADAIGGSVNLVTKSPEGPFRGYAAGQFGQGTLLARTQGQGSLMYGGRVGQDQKFGILFGGTWDHNNRAINDLELGWGANGGGTPIPVEWDQRDYMYDRSRIGANGAMDYRFNDGSTAFVKGMWSKFNNFGTRYRYDVATGADSAQASSGATGIGTGSSMVREVSSRTPVEQMFAFNGGGKKLAGTTELSYGLNYSGTRSRSVNYRTNDFEYDGPGGNGLALKYDGTNRYYPTFQYLSASDAALATTASNYDMTKYKMSDGRTKADEGGAQADALMHYSLGSLAAQLKVGAKYREEQRDNVDLSRQFNASGSVLLSTLVGAFKDPSYYSFLARGYSMGPQPDEGATSAFESTHPSMFVDKTDAIGDSLGNFTGREKVTAAYAMHTMDIGALRINVGLRAEHTAINFSGNVATTIADSSGNPTGSTTLRRVNGSQSYTDLFPSAQFRYALGDETNLRFAVTRGIARPNYSDLAPSLTGDVCSTCQFQFGNLSAGNPDLKPQHAWNVDLLGEHYLSSAGVLSAGVFYKRITDFIYSRQFVYQGPATEFDGYYGTQPANGGAGSVIGAEFDYTQRLEFLPGAWSGLGFDVNWMQADSRAQLLADTAQSAATLGHPTVRNAQLPRQAKSVGNLALTFDSPRVSARAGWQYQGASIFSYGDGSATPSGDDWLFPHSQIDASVTLTLKRDVSLQIQGLNLNNAVFGFFNGLPNTRYSVQREYYGRSVILGVKYGLGDFGGSR